MSRKTKNTEPAGRDLLENPEALAEQLSRTEQFVEKNKTAVTAVGILFLLIVLGYMFYNYYVSEQDKMAQREIYQAIYYFEADSLGRALNGDGNNFGFLEVIETYGMTKTANLAHFYAGAAYLKLGDYENAISYLEEFSASDYLVQSRAYSLIGDAYMSLNEYEKAGSYFEKAANNNVNKQFSPTYLVKAAIANERNNDLQSAIANYQTILDDYYDAAEYNDAKKHLARLEGLAN